MKSHYLPHIVIACAVAFMAYFYTFGIDDQGIYIPFISKMLDPHLYPNDPLLLLQKDYIRFIWYFVKPLFLIFGVQLSFFLLYILSYLLIFSGVYMLVHMLTHSRNLGILGVIMTLIPKLPLVPVTITMPYFAPRLLVIGLVLWVMYLFINQRYVYAFVLMALGVLFNIIFIFPLVLVLPLRLMQETKLSARAKVFILTMFGIVSSPIFLLRAFTENVAQTPVLDSGWVMFARFMLPIFFFLPGTSDSILEWTYVAFGIAFFIVVAYLLRKTQLPHRTYTVFRDIWLVCLVLTIATYFMHTIFPMVLFYQMQLTRVTYFIPVLFILLVCRYINQNLSTLKNNPPQMYALIVNSVVGIPFLTLINLNFRTKVLSFITIFISLLITVAGGVYISQPETNIFADLTQSIADTPEYDAQIWMKENTPLDSLFITPSCIDEKYTPNFRVFSQRSILFSNSELGESVLTYTYKQDLEQRLNDLTRGEYEKNFDSFHQPGTLYELLYTSYTNTTTEQFVKLGQKYTADYVVVEVDQHLDLPVVYTNTKYRIYQLPSRS